MRTLLALFFSLTPLSFADLRVVSDLDDTVKVTHVENTVDMVWNALYSQRVFAGMSELYLAWDAPTTFVSGSPKAKFMERRTRRTLDQAGFKDYTLYLKLWFGRHAPSDTRQFKQSVLEPILAADQVSDFIFVGDDIEADATVYCALAAQHPSRVLAIYIHRIATVSGPMPCPEQTTTYVSPYEIAIHEYARGRLSEDDVSKVGQAILESNDLTAVHPAWAYCPEKGWLEPAKALLPGHLTSQIDAVASRIEKICRR